MGAQANNKENKKKLEEDEKGPLGINYEAEDVFAGAEPWEPIETKLVVGSFIAAFFFLGLFATLVHIYILK